MRQNRKRGTLNIFSTAFRSYFGNDPLFKSKYASFFKPQQSKYNDSHLQGIVNYYKSPVTKPLATLNKHHRNYSLDLPSVYKAKNMSSYYTSQKTQSGKITPKSTPDGYHRQYKKPLINSKQQPFKARSRALSPISQTPAQKYLRQLYTKLKDKLNVL